MTARVAIVTGASSGIGLLVNNAGIYVAKPFTGSRLVLLTAPPAVPRAAAGVREGVAF